MTYKGYRLEVTQVGSTFSYAIERMRPELPIAARRTEHRLPTKEQAVASAQRRVDRLLKAYV